MVLQSTLQDYVCNSYVMIGTTRRKRRMGECQVCVHGKGRGKARKQRRVLGRDQGRLCDWVIVV